MAAAMPVMHRQIGISSVVCLLALTAACAQPAAVSPPAAKPAATTRPELQISLVLDQTAFDSVRADTGMSVRFSNNTTHDVLLPVGKIWMDGNLFVSVYRPSGANPFDTPDNFPERMPGFPNITDEVVTIAAGGSYDLSLRGWPYSTWSSYIPGDSDQSGDWCVKARFDAEYDSGVRSADSDGPPVWRTSCLSPPVKVTFRHALPTTAP